MVLIPSVQAANIVELKKLIEETKSGTLVQQTSPADTPSYVLSVLDEGATEIRGIKYRDSDGNSVENNSPAVENLIKLVSSLCKTE